MDNILLIPPKKFSSDSLSSSPDGLSSSPDGLSSSPPREPVASHLSLSSTRKTNASTRNSSNKSIRSFGSSSGRSRRRGLLEQQVGEKRKKIDQALLKKSVEYPDRYDKEILKHYNSYTRRSPESDDNFFDAIINYGSLRKNNSRRGTVRALIEDPINKQYNTKGLPLFFPKSVILLITMHGRTKEPFLIPVNVYRRIGADFGTCYYDYYERFDTLMASGFKRKTKKNGEYIKSSISSAMNDSLRKANALPPEVFEDHEEHELHSEFLLSKYNKFAKKFKKNMPMFNKSYSMEDETSHINHSIYVRADLPEGSLEKDIFFEIQTQRTTLKKILLFLAERGVENASLFDLSCQEDRRSPIHRTRYGGSAL